MCTLLIFVTYKSLYIDLCCTIPSTLFCLFLFFSRYSMSIDSLRAKPKNNQHLSPTLLYLHGWQTVCL